MMWTDDPVRDAERYQQELESLLDEHESCLCCFTDSDDIELCEDCTELKGVGHDII